MEFNIVKAAIKKAVEQIVTSDSWDQCPVVVVDYHNWAVIKFDDDFDAQEYLERYCNLSDWCDRELPYNGEDDEEIVVIKYCGGYVKKTHPLVYKDYKFFKEIDGVEIYRKKILANFEASVSMSVNI
ncbi:hypothetical protein SporoP37_15770 [Sporosarcina sp. P37]|uniref:hypothetical protein n=1 Tax=unclassified Sporosarcina TaxID=2647733 RepID=UPI000A179C5A|nr:MULTISPECIES: hypothetical protein [unclassified Sporosarcina]ARK25984.1 hypothetical protein SporoP37_15770 [Sporosarcina sp. P37]PID19354.1 hypothetical protein CSV62_02290 [Sporosarcina sp. P35]